MRPETGVQPRMPEKNMISSRPHQKIGMEKPTSAVDMIAWSVTLPRRTAAKTPAGMPSATAKRMAQSDSSTVAGKSVKKSSATGRLVTIDRPRSPCRMPPR